jgi:hypothetical protein
MSCPAPSMVLQAARVRDAKASASKAAERMELSS